LKIKKKKKIFFKKKKGKMEAELKAIRQLLEKILASQADIISAMDIMREDIQEIVDAIDYEENEDDPVPVKEDDLEEAEIPVPEEAEIPQAEIPLAKEAEIPVPEEQVPVFDAEPVVETNEDEYTYASEYEEDYTYGSEDEA
jgi:hypothetical protein